MESNNRSCTVIQYHIKLPNFFLYISHPHDSHSHIKGYNIHVYVCIQHDYFRNATSDESSGKKHKSHFCYAVHTENGKNKKKSKQFLRSWYPKNRVSGKKLRQKKINHIKKTSRILQIKKLKRLKNLVMYYYGRVYFQLVINN